MLFRLSWLWFVACSYQIIMTENKEKHQLEGPIYYYMFNTLLFRLLVLYIFWWVLIYRMLVKQVQDRGKLSEDVRSGMFSKSLYCGYIFLSRYSKLVSFCRFWKWWWSWGLIVLVWTLFQEPKEDSFDKRDFQHQAGIFRIITGPDRF